MLVFGCRLGSFPAGTPGNGVPKVILTVGTAFPGTQGAVHILYNGLTGGWGFRNLLCALYEGERGVCADVI